MTSRRLQFPSTLPSDSGRLGRAFGLVLLLLAAVAGLGLYELHSQGRQQQQRAVADAGRSRAAQELLDSIGQCGLLTRQLLLAGESPAATGLRQRLAEAQDRSLALERVLRSGAAVPAWMNTLLDGAAGARSQTLQLYDQAQRQTRDGQSADALRTLGAQVDLAEARWRTQVEEVQRQIDLQAQVAQAQARETEQRRLLQYFAWSLCAWVAAAALAWSALRRKRESFEQGLRTVSRRDELPPLPGTDTAKPATGPTRSTGADLRALLGRAAPAAGHDTTGPGSERSVGAFGRGRRKADSAAPTQAAGAVGSAGGAVGADGFTARAKSEGFDTGRIHGTLHRAASERSAEGAGTGGASSGWPALDRLAGSLSRSGPSGGPSAVGPDAGQAAAAASGAPSGQAGHPGQTSPAGATTGGGSAVREAGLAGAAPASDRTREVLMRDAVAAATRGGLVVSQVVANMEDIGSTGRRIAEIVALIDSIAFQTNLLALNAVVEAAHSEAEGGPSAALANGASGAAADVRNLARRATQAAREIKALIAAGLPAAESLPAPGEAPLGTAGAASVGPLGGATAALQHDASQTMDALLTSVQQAAELVAQVRRAAEGDAPAAEVAQSVEQLDRMKRSHEALVAQSAASAESLRQQAERLQKVLGAFKLLQQTQQAAWGAHTAIRSASERARGVDSGFGRLVADGLDSPARQPRRDGTGGPSDSDDAASGGWTSF